MITGQSHSCSPSGPLPQKLAKIKGDVEKRVITASRISTLVTLHKVVQFAAAVAYSSYRGERTTQWICLVLNILPV